MGTLSLDDVAGLVAQSADLLVHFLPADALRDEFHDDVLCGHEGESEGVSGSVGKTGRQRSAYSSIKRL
jgi:hypothetical protein